MSKKLNNSVLEGKSQKKEGSISTTHNLQVMFSKKSDDWSTPKDFYDKLDKEFNFDFDPCPLRDNDKNAMFIDWIGNIFINPPYSNIKNFIEKGLIEYKKGNAKKLVYLVPSRTDTKWFMI